MRWGRGIWHAHAYNVLIKAAVLWFPFPLSLCSSFISICTGHVWTLLQHYYCWYHCFNKLISFLPRSSIYFPVICIIRFVFLTFYKLINIVLSILDQAQMLKTSTRMCNISSELCKQKTLKTYLYQKVMRKPKQNHSRPENQRSKLLYIKQNTI